MSASLWDPASIIPISGHFTELTVDTFANIGTDLSVGNDLSVDGAITGPTIAAINAALVSDVWISPAFNAANFTASGAMTWTVDSGDVMTYAYKLRNKSLSLSVYINATTVGGVVSSQLRIAIPAGQLTAKNTVNTCMILDNGVRSVAYFTAVTGLGYITINRADGSNFTLAANNTYVLGQIDIEVV